MEQNPQAISPQQGFSKSNNLSYPNQLDDASKSMASITKLLLESSKTLSTLRREFRGEALSQAVDGTSQWIQISKPIFCKMDFLKEKPLKERITMPDGEVREFYIPNDEAIEEILSMLKFAGLNQITSITNISEDNILDDLREFECKLAAVLCLKQKEWGIDKEVLPMIQFKIKTIVQDARYMAKEGGTLKALQTTVSRVEQVLEGDRMQKKMNASPYA
ncbi:MAG TPA: hypothetical protein ENG87_03925 [Candidatus Pacearchaeota archaeon]|nr:hypothetical protein [Candidatus Pacearchaeota archaeon]HDZ61180.1 hypothetical protein [Candidatus Pacearchaeota archaeon]